MKVAVVGAGAVGVTVAHDVAVGDESASVTVFERSDVAAGSSGRAAGVCYEIYADPTDARIGQRSIERFRALSDDPGVAYRFEDCPYVWVVREGDDERAAAIREQVPRMQAHRLDAAFVDPDDLAEAFPALAVDDVAVAAISRNAGHTDPAQYVRAMAERAESEGVEIRTETEATLDATSDGPVVETADGIVSFDAVVVAAGAHTKQVLADAGVAVPLKPYRVQALTTVANPIRGALPMLYDATGGYYLRPHHDGGVLVGDGTEPVERDPDDWDSDADDWFVDDCSGYMETAFGRSLDVERAWAGLCVATPDGNPLVGEVAEGVYVAAGWQGHGFMRAPAIGELLVEEVLGNTAGVASFDPSRFDGDEDFEIVEGMERATQNE